MATGAAGLVAGNLPEQPEAFVAFYRMRFELATRRPLDGLLASIDNGTHRQDYLAIPRHVEWVQALAGGKWVETDGRILTRRNE